MGNVNARQIEAKKINTQINLINTVNRFLNKDKPDIDNNIKCTSEKLSQINEKSNINKYLNSNKTIELSTDLISIFSNQHINHFNNGNLYASLLTPNIYETSEEEKNNISPKISQANYITHTFNRINDILNVNNDKLILDKVNILRNLTKSPPNMSKDVFIFNSANQNFGLNESYNSNYNDLINEPNGNLSRGHSKRYTRLNTFVTKKSADGIYYEEEPPFSSRDTYKKKKSSKSIKHITLNDSPYQKIPLNKISEDNNQDFEKEEKELEKHTMLSKSKSKTAASKLSHDLSYLKDKKVYSKFNNTNRRNNYAQFIRTKFFNGSFKRKDIKNSFERNRFDLFNSKIIDQLRTEEKKDLSKKNNNNGMLINSKNNKLKNESNMHFKINLKVIIKQEIQEKLNTPKLEKENKTEKITYTTTNKKLFSENSSEYFRDSINKYLNFDNTITKSYKKSTRKSSKILKSPSFDMLSSVKKYNNDILAKISISKFNEKENTPMDLSPVSDSLLLQHIEMLNLDDCL